MAIFFQNKSFCFINQNPLDSSRYQLAFPKFRVFIHLWATDFWVYTAGLHTPFQHFYGLSSSMIMSNRECRVFHPGGGGGGGGIYPNLLCPTHIFFFFFLNRETHFRRYPMLPSPPSNTKHSVDLYHALTMF